MGRKSYIKLYILFILFAGCCIAGIFSYKIFLVKFGFHRQRETKVYDEIIFKVAKRYSVDPLLVKAVIWKESGFDAGVVGTKGEIGLMQIKQNGAVEDWMRNKKIKVPCRGLLFCPDLNIEIGAWYLAKAMRYWQKKYKHFRAIALCEYNAGRTNVKKWLPSSYDGDIIKNITFQSTRKYVISILNKYKEYRRKTDE